jgi:hypothetical protein
VEHLTQVSISLNTDNASKAKGFLKKLTNGKWVFTYFMQLLLPQLVRLSKTLQDNESTIETMRVKLDANTVKTVQL